MKFIFKIEHFLIAISSVLCTIIVLKLIYLLRSILPWRVNCWFCNNNFWVKFIYRNSWTCPNCEQYNGFTKDGDYNRPLVTTCDTNLKTPKIFRSPKNGLCRMCNINQQLKVVQLANFVPMNDRNYDEEVDAYRFQLEKAYKLCSPCQKVLQMKLYKEKESLLGSKLLESRSPDKKSQKKLEQKQTTQNIINKTSKYVALLILMLVSIECYENIMNNDKLSKTMQNISQIMTSLLERVLSIVKMKLLMTFPALEVHFKDVHILYTDFSSKYLAFSIENVDQINLLIQESLGGFVCSIQIIGHIWNINTLTYTFIIDLLWTVFGISTIMHHYVAEPIIMSLVKFTCITAVLLLYRSMKPKIMKSPRTSTTPKKMKNLTNGSMNSFLDEAESMETDDDVSLSNFGLHNSSNSSNDDTKHQNSSLINGRSFTPRSNDDKKLHNSSFVNSSSFTAHVSDNAKLHNSSLITGRSFTPRNNDSIWSKSPLNSTFCVNPALNKSPSSISESVFTKPIFNKYQNLSKGGDSESDSDLSISSLHISSPKKKGSGSKKSPGSVFAMRQFTATPSFAVPIPLNRKPLISPSKLGHSTSWVAGGYWGSDERQMFSVDGSRSSSQSSGFESQASSMNQRNLFSQPSSREDSVCGESERTMFDRFSKCSTNGPHHFSRVNSPVYPQMQYNGHVHIPQPRVAVQNAYTQVYAQSTRFKPTGGSGLIKLPQVNPFQSR